MPSLPPTRRGEKPAAAVLLLGNYRPTLTVARSLARDGHRVVLGLDHDGEGSAQYSNAVREIWKHPPLGPGGGFRRALDALLGRRPDIGIIVPVAEKFVRWCAENHALLDGRVVVVSPAPATVLRCLDKRRTIDLARAAGVPCLPSATAGSLPGLYENADAIGYPLVVRPLNHLLRLGDRKAVIAGDAAALRRALPAWPAGQDRVLLQRFASGARHDVYFAARRGEALRFLEVRILRTDSPDGTGLSVEGVSAPLSAELAGYVRRLVRRLDYTGIGCAQFLVDPADGSVCFLELNPRIAGSHRCTETAGMHLVRHALSLAGAAPCSEDGPFDYAPGRRYAWTYGDLRALSAAVSARTIGRVEALRWLAAAAGTFLRAHYHLTWDWSDPWPTVRLFLGRAWPKKRGRGLRSPDAAKRNPGSVAPNPLGR